jgi:hypothetical protein
MNAHIVAVKKLPGAISANNNGALTSMQPLGNLRITMQNFHGQRLCAGALLPQDSLRHIEICQRCEKLEVEVIAPSKENAPELLALRKSNDERLEALRGSKRIRQDIAT